MKAVPEEDTIVLIAIGQYIGEGYLYDYDKKTVAVADIA